MNDELWSANDSANGIAPVWIDAAALRTRLPMLDAVDAVEAAFALPRRATGPERQVLEVPDGELLLMPASGPEGVGVKLVTVTPGNSLRDEPLIHGVYALFAPGSQRPEALIDGAGLTGVRTAAVSGLATRLLAREDARQLVVFGSGAQAWAHVEAMLAVRPIARVDVVGLEPKRARALVDGIAEAGVDARVAGPEAVRDADIICTCTTAGEPLFPAEWVAPGTHVNAIGAYRTDRRELDGALLADALLVVESRSAALAEAGDVVLAIAEGAITDAAIDAELTDVLSGAVARTDAEQRTVFKSVGLAVEDLVLARAAVDARAPRP